jgi:hypothetical protein
MQLTAAKSNRRKDQKKQSGKMRKPREVDPEKEQRWRQVFLRFQASGLPFKKFCSQENISANTFQYWRRELQHRDQERGLDSTIKKGDNRPSKMQERITFWLGVINEINVHPGSIRGYCRSRGISSGSLHFWEKKLKSMKLSDGIERQSSNKKKQNVHFALVNVAEDAQPEVNKVQNETDGCWCTPDRFPEQAAASCRVG